MSGVFARLATSDDHDHLERLRAAARIEESEHRGEWVSAPGADVGARRIEVVGGWGDSVFGAVSAVEASGGLWVIDLVHVDKAARGVGIGNALVAKLLGNLARLGCAGVRASAQPGDRSLKNLFERHGLVARTILVGRDFS